MKRQGMMAVAVLALFTLLGCAKSTLAPDMTARDLTPEYQAGKTKSKVDNFLVVMDASLSMEESDGEYVKLDLAKAFVQRMNNTLPPLQATAGLRTFGHNPAVARTFTALLYGMAPYQRQDLARAVDKVSVPGGTSPMLQAIQAAGEDLKPLSGQSALIIVSDGKDIDNAPVKALEGMHQEMADRLCVYTILVGNDPGGAALMQKLAAVTACGFATTARNVATAEQMADFVNTVFLTERVVPVPPPPRPAVDKDSDGDGVPDRLDRCPGTPKGARVDAHGCWILENVLFDFDKSHITSSMTGRLDQVLVVLRNNPSVGLEIHGHTDSIGSADYNMRLSQRRADAVKAYFTQRGIDGNRLITKAFGESRPTSDNTTVDGRTLNRRVELKPIK